MGVGVNQNLEGFHLSPNMLVASLRGQNKDLNMSGQVAEHTLCVVNMGV